MKHVFLLILILLLSALPLLAADNCRNYSNTQMRMQIAGMKPEMERLGKKIERQFQEMDLEEKDYRARVRELERERYIKDELIAAIEAEKKKLFTEQRLRDDELSQGLYCSQCKRSKSQIEKEDGESFAKHMKGVSGKPVPASQELHIKTYNKFKEKRDRLTEKMRKVMQEQDLIDDKITAMTAKMEIKRGVRKSYEGELKALQKQEQDLTRAMANDGCYPDRLEE